MISGKKAYRFIAFAIALTMVLFGCAGTPDETDAVFSSTPADGLALRSANGMDDEKLDSTLQSWLDKLPSSNS